MVSRLGGSFVLQMIKGGEKVNISKDMLKPKISKPTAKDLEDWFFNYLEMCSTDSRPPNNLAWIAYLGISREQYRLYGQEKKNSYLNDMEFSERLSTIKKIDEMLEVMNAETLMTAKQNPAGLIFFLKNAYRWSDRQEPEVSLNLKIDGYNIPQPSKNKADNNDK